MAPAQPTIAVISVHADPVAALGSGQNGGMNLAIRRLAESLAERGVCSDIFTRRTEASQAAVESIGDNVRVIRVDLGEPEPRSAASLAAHTAELADSITAAMGDVDYAVVHGHHWVSGVVAESVARRRELPWVQSFHTLALTKAAAGLATEAGRADIERHLCASADRLVAMSGAEADELRAQYEARPERICVVQPGSDPVLPHHAEELRRRLDLDGHRVILYAGRLEPLKGTDTLLDAIACLVSGDGHDDVIALIVGDDASAGERGRLEALAQRNGIAGRVRFVGSVAHDDLADYYAVADVCVVPSRAETFGLVALEAEAAGVTVIAADVGGLREVVVDGVTGYLVPAGDVEGFCARIAEVLDDAERRARMGEAGRRRAAEFTWERAAARLEAIYQRVAAGDAVTPCGDT